MVKMNQIAQKIREEIENTDDGYKWKYVDSNYLNFLEYFLNCKANN